jgi:molybdenum cofactor guanylyltransferase
VCDGNGEYDLAILCGGAGRRMGGQDKGLLGLHPLQRHVTFVEMLIERLPYPGLPDESVIISANRNLDIYGRMPGTVVSDLRPERVGPLGGIESVMAIAPGNRPLVIVPCDMPLLPALLPRELVSSLCTPDTIAVLHDGIQRQPLCLALNPGHWRADLSDWLDSGCRSVHGWLEHKPVVEVRFPGIDTVQFANINYPHDYAAVRAQPQHSDRFGILTG